jgi:hypothetical protein
VIQHSAVRAREGFKFSSVLAREGFKFSTVLAREGFKFSSVLAREGFKFSTVLALEGFKFSTVLALEGFKFSSLLARERSSTVLSGPGRDSAQATASTGSELSAGPRGIQVDQVEVPALKRGLSCATMSPSSTQLCCHES